jgi:hypothetical protein
MSLFKKPKKALQKQNARIFTSEIELMDVEDEEQLGSENKHKKKDKKDKSSKSQKSSLLSFAEGI